MKWRISARDGRPVAIPEPDDQASPELPSFSQGTPADPALPRHEYGESRTIHQTGTIDIQIDAHSGAIIAVWYRCLSLPFRVSAIQDRQPINPDIYIEKIVYVENELCPITT